MSEPRIEVRAGSIATLETDRARFIPLPPLPWDLHREAVVFADAGGAVRAYLNRCKHVPVPLDGGTRDVFDTTKRFLLCGTHGALYDRGSGLCVSGPCRGQSLLALETRVDADGEVWIVLGT